MDSLTCPSRNGDSLREDFAQQQGDLHGSEDSSDESGSTTRTSQSLATKKSRTPQAMGMCSMCAEPHSEQHFEKKHLRHGVADPGVCMLNSLPSSNCALNLGL